MVKVVKDLNSIMVECHGNKSEAARRLGVNRGALNAQVQKKENAYLVLDNGDVYKRTSKKYLHDLTDD